MNERKKVLLHRAIAHCRWEKLWKIYDENSYSWTAAPHKVSALLETNEKKFFSHSCMASIFKHHCHSRTLLYHIAADEREGKREFFADLNKAKNQQHHSDVALQKGGEEMWEKLCLHYGMVPKAHTRHTHTQWLNMWGMNKGLHLICMLCK